MRLIMRNSVIALYDYYKKKSKTASSSRLAHFINYELKNQPQKIYLEPNDLYKLLVILLEILIQEKRPNKKLDPRIAGFIVYFFGEERFKAYWKVFSTNENLPRSVYDSINFCPHEFAMNAAILSDRFIISRSLYKRHCTAEEFQDLLGVASFFNFDQNHGKALFAALLKKLNYAESIAFAFDWLRERNLLTFFNVSKVIAYASKISALEKHSIVYKPTKGQPNKNQDVFNAVIAKINPHQEPVLVYAKITIEQIEELNLRYLQKIGRNSSYKKLLAFILKMNQTHRDKYQLLSNDNLYLFATLLCEIHLHDRFKLHTTHQLIEKFLEGAFGKERAKAFLKLYDVPMQTQLLKSPEDSYGEIYKNIFLNHKPKLSRGRFDIICYLPSSFIPTWQKLMNTGTIPLIYPYMHMKQCSYADFQRLVMVFADVNLNSDLLNSILTKLTYARELTEVFLILKRWNLLKEANIRVIVEHADLCDKFIAKNPPASSALSSYHLQKLFDKLTIESHMDQTIIPKLRNRA